VQALAVAEGLHGRGQLCLRIIERIRGAAEGCV
jgi:hypothetical protein